jgi:hypothetical protein
MTFKKKSAATVKVSGRRIIFDGDIKIDDVDSVVSDGNIKTCSNIDIRCSDAVTAPASEC